MPQERNQGNGDCIFGSKPHQTRMAFTLSSDWLDYFPNGLPEYHG